MKIDFTKLLIITSLIACSGCSSLGLTLWPSQLPLLDKAKEFAARSSVPSGLDVELAKQPLSEYFIEPGDRLLIEPVELDSKFVATGDQEVKVDGSVDLGRYGRIRVSGMTVEQIEVAVNEQILSVSGDREVVNVQLLESNAAEVYVLGAVGSPGAFDIKGNETVLDVILMAGGLTSKASPCDIILVRPTGDCECRIVQRVCFRQITQLGDVTTNYQIQPGDRVVVGERTLHEELAFWKQSTECPCCDRSRCVERLPENKGYRNRFVSWRSPLPFPNLLPRKEGDLSNVKSQNADKKDAEAVSPTPAKAPAKDPKTPTTNEAASPSDDIFLPPELPQTKSGDSSRTVPRYPSSRFSFDSSSRGR